MRKNGFFRNNWKKITASGALAAMLLLPATAPKAEAVDVFDVLGGIYGVSETYSEYLDYMLDTGNLAENQYSTQQKDVADKGPDLNDEEVALVDQVMHQLLNQGKYVLDVQSLPFRWKVTNRSDFNACCYSSDYISVNRGLLLGLHNNPDEVAAVLGHEMTHGLEQHAAHNLANIMAQQYGISLLQQSTNVLAGTVIGVLGNYSAAKNIVLPSEADADQGGFYLMVSAGFNPGGTPAAMSRMQYFTQNVADFSDFFNPSDHPNTDKRLLTTSKLMSQYGYNHVEVRNGNEVWVDGKLLVKAENTATDYDNSPENAYLIAGGIVKGLHDYRVLALWDFHPVDGGVDYLNGDAVYAPLKAAVSKNGQSALLEKLVSDAYAADVKSGNRDTINAELAKYTQKLQEKAEKAKKAEPEHAERMLHNGAMYNDQGQPDLALFEVQRSLNYGPATADTYAVRGVSYALKGNYDKALADCSQALTLDANSPIVYTNRAVIYHAMGNDEAALADCQKALMIDTNIKAAYKMEAEIYDGRGDHDSALKNYRKYKILAPKAQDIPEAYASELD